MPARRRTFDRSIRHLALFAVGAFACLAVADEPATVDAVERQPLLAQVHRVAEALDTIGAPLSPETAAAIEELKSAVDDAEATRRVQALLDPLTIATVALSKDAPPAIAAGSADRSLVDQAWRTFLVKVVNPEGVEGPLAVESPNSLPVPTSPPEQVAERWMQLTAFDGQPMKKELSGLGLEYRIVQIAGNGVGARQGELRFRVGEAKDGNEPGKVSLDFKLAPATLVRFRVTDDKGRPTIACFEIRGTDGGVYPAQSKRLAPDFFFQRQIYRGDGETVSLPAGTYSVVCSRGPESIPETRELVVGAQPVDLAYRVERWIDPTEFGYWSGDHHIHAAGCQHYENPTQGVHPEDMFRHIVGEDLKVGCCLTWGPCFDFQKRFFTGEVAEQSQHPYLLRYDVEVSGFGSHRSGHLNLLNLQEQIYPGGESKDHWPTLGLNTLRWAKRQGAVCGPAHSANGLQRVVGRLPKSDGLDGPDGLPTFDIPAYDGIGANEYVVDVTHEVEGPGGEPTPAIDFISAMDTDRKAEWNIWYHTLNCGYRVAVSGETDFPCIYGERVGIGRVYARVDGDLTFPAWVAALDSGDSYVSDGKCHLIDLFVGTGGAEAGAPAARPGEELRWLAPGQARASLTVAVRLDDAPEIPVELIVNGYPVAEKRIRADGQSQRIDLEAPLEKSSWVAVRAFPHAHTNPVYVIVEDRPIRANEASARWCLAGVEQCWTTKKETYAESERAAAEAAYEHARQAYRRIIEEHAGN